MPTQNPVHTSTQAPAVPNSENCSILGLKQAQIKLKKIMCSTTIHAIILHGKQGIGKKNLATIYARFWLCNNTSNKNLECSCKACTTYLSTNNPDVFICSPSPANRMITLSSISGKIGKEQSVKSFSLTTPLVSKNKVIILHDVDCLTRDAAHSLLKILEEPPANVKFILTTSEVSKVLDTILSRCIIVDCDAPTEENLIEKYGPLSLEEELFSYDVPERIELVRKNKDLYNEWHQNLSTILLDSTVPMNLKSYQLAESILNFSAQIEKLSDSSKKIAMLETLLSLTLWWKNIEKKNLTEHSIQKLLALCKTHQSILMNGNLKIQIHALAFQLTSS